MDTASATFVALAVVLSAVAAPAASLHPPGWLPAGMAPSDHRAQATAATADSGAPRPPMSGLPPPAPLPAPRPPPALGVPHASGSLTIITPTCQLTGAPAPLSAAAGNFTLTASFTGALLDECNDSALNGDGYTMVTAANASPAIELFDVRSVQVTGFLVVGAATGILVEGAQSSEVLANTINATGYGVEVEYSTGVTVEDNTLDGDYGSLYEVDDGLTVSYNLMEHTSYSAFAEDVNGASFVSDQCNGSGVALSVYDSSSVSVWGDNLSNSSYGLFAENVNHLSVDWNNASFSQYPIQVYYGGAISGAENAGLGAIVGMTIYFSDNATFTTERFVAANEYGAEIEDATNVSITGSDFDLAGFEAIYVGDATHVALTGDTADVFADAGVVVSQSTDVTITGTHASNGSGSLAPAFSTYFDQQLTLADSNGSASPFGLEDQGSLNLTVEDCAFQRMVGGDAGISLQSDTQVTVTGTQITFASGDALDAFDSAGLVVRDNLFTHAAQEAIFIASSDGVTVDGNDASAPGFTGLDLEELDGFTVTNNNASLGTGAYSDGIYLQSDASGTVVGNNLTNLRTALQLLDATNVLVQGNSLSAASVGFEAAGDVSCTIAGNQVVGDTASFDLGSSEHLAIFHNNFIDDGGWVLPASALDVNWSAGYPGGGNYWSNWTAPDDEHGPAQNLSGPDGIVDRPFVINATNADPYPLAAPWVTRTITFTETGLPVGTSWSVAVNGTTESGTGTTLTYPQPDAVANVYDYRVGPVAGYRATNGNGTVAPRSGDAEVAIAFAPFEFPVSFQASGLASDANWSVTVGSVAGGANGGEPVAFELANGSYSFSVAPVTDYAASPDAGTLLVAGTDQSLTIQFTLILFPVTFVATGLAGGASWSVELAGAERTSTGGALSFEEPDGNYSFSVVAPSGSVAHPTSGVMAVNGSTVVYLAFTSPGSSPLETPLGDALLVATIALAIVAVVALALWARARRAGPPPAPGAAVPEGPPGPPESPERWRR